MEVRYWVATGKALGNLWVATGKIMGVDSGWVLAIVRFCATAGIPLSVAPNLPLLFKRHILLFSPADQHQREALLYQ